MKLLSKFVIPLVICLSAVVAGDSNSDSDSEDQDGVFSQAFLDEYCILAQQIVAQTSLEAQVEILDDLGQQAIPFPTPIPATGFVASVAKPFDGMENLPFTVTQFVGYGVQQDDSEDEDDEPYAQTVLCKMKNADALDVYFPDETFTGQDCTAVSRRILELVLDALDEDDDDLPQIEFDNWVTFAGNQWTDSSPAPSAYVDAAGVLHLVSKELYVDRLNPSPFFGPDRKGIIYCQTIAPAYLRLILEEDVVPPTCAAPPVYTPPTGFPVVLPWDCANP